jgi:hypothetical protein
MRHPAHFICYIFGGGAVIFGIIGLVRAQWESGVNTLCLGAALFLLALIYDKMLEVGEINAKLDRLLEQSPGGPPRS